MFFFSRFTSTTQPETLPEAQPETLPEIISDTSVQQITAHIDFVLYTDSMTSREILQTLRRDLIEFSEAYDLAWAVTQFNVGTSDPDVIIPIQIKLTEDQDVVYTIDGDLYFLETYAAAALDGLRAELVF